MVRAGAAGLFSLLFLLNPAPRTAMASSSEGKRVRAIRFVPPLQPLPDDELRALIPIEPGEPLDALKVRQAIERIYATGRYSDIVVAADAEGEVVDIEFQTTGRWFVGRVQVDGVPEPPNQAQLVSGAKLALGREFEVDDLDEASAGLQQKLIADGFYRAKIDPHVNYEARTQQAFVNFSVTGADRASYTRPIVNGVSGLQEELAVNATGWKRLFGLLGWRDVTESRTSRGIERIRQRLSKRDYLLSSVVLQEMHYLDESNEVRPEIHVETGPKVRVRVEGFKLSKGKLRELVPVFLEGSVDRDLLIEGMRNISSYLGSQGYFRAHVSFHTNQDSDGATAIIYRIDPGPRYRLARLEITGVRYFGLDTIRERMGTLPATLLRYRHGRFSEDLLAADVQNIKELYLSNGFRDVQVRTRVEEKRDGEANELEVFLEVEEGPQWLVSHLEIEGVSPRHRQAIDWMLALVPGQPYSEANVLIDRDAVLNYYYNLGYLNATFEWRAEPDTEPNRMQVFFQVREGPQRYLREILITGLEASDPEMVRRRLQIHPGESLSQAKIIESQRRLYDLGVFARVGLAIQNPEGEERSKYLLFQLEEASRYSFNLGIGAELARIGGGVTNFDAPAGAPGFSPRTTFGISRSNMFGVGHTGSFQGRVSNIQQRGVLTYLAPQFKGRENLSLTLNGVYDFSQDIRTFASRRLEGVIQFSQRINLSDTGQVRFAYRRNTIFEGSLKIDPELIPVFSLPSRVGILSASWLRERRDNPVDSTRGYFTNIDFGSAAGFFGSQTDFLRLLARNSSYHRIGDEIILARSFVFGLQRNTASSQRESDIPLPERFFAGGSSTHRGFPDNQAGPRDLSTGFPLGGSALLMHNLELRFPLLGDAIGGVLFHDMGNVYSRVQDISFRYRQRDLEDFNYAVHAAGFGLRYRTPVGPIRLDLAFAPNSPRFFGFEGSREDLIAGTGRKVNQRISRFQFHFSLGQTF
jgi:outer membrane protein insertion porin family